MFWTRVASGIVAAPLFLLVVYLGAPYFNILVAAIAAVMAWEFTRMDTGQGAKRGGLIIVACVAAVAIASVVSAGAALLLIAVATVAVIAAEQVAGRKGVSIVQGAVPYVAVPAVALIVLMTHGGWQTTFWFLAVVWMTDIGAYGCGRLIGGPRLAPAISPNKTWSGAVGGLVIGTGSGLLLLSALNGAVTMKVIAASLCVSVLTEIGDLFESWLKRRYHVKDSGGLIPGHGGVMDRFDGLWAAAPAAALLCVVFAGGVQSW